MKWTKFDPKNPPSDAYTLWCFAIPANTAFAFGKYYEHLGLRCFHEDAVTSFSPNELQTYNAHWINPQDIPLTSEPMFLSKKIIIDEVEE